MLNPMTFDLADDESFDLGAHCMGGPNAFHDTEYHTGI